MFSIELSFFVLFMVIIGGLGSLIGSFFGAALIHVLPILLRAVPPLVGVTIGAATVEHLFLIAEPLGLARLWQTGKQKLRTWPFPY